MNISFFNPCAGLIETRNFPHSRVLRTTFPQKLQDAFWIFFGNFGYQSYKDGIIGFFSDVSSASSFKSYYNHLGVLDCLTFGIPYGLDFLSELARKYHIDNNIFGALARFLLGVICLSLRIAKFLIASVLTFNPLSLLIIFVIHVVSQNWAGGAKLKEDAAKAELSIYSQPFKKLALVPRNHLSHDKLLELAQANPETLYIIEKDEINAIELLVSPEKVIVYGRDEYKEMERAKVDREFPKEAIEIIEITGPLSIKFLKGIEVPRPTQNIKINNFYSKTISLLEVAFDKNTKEVTQCSFFVSSSINPSYQGAGFLLFPNQNNNLNKEQAKACIALIELNEKGIANEIEKHDGKLETLKSLAMN